MMAEETGTQTVTNPVATGNEPAPAPATPATPEPAPAANTDPAPAPTNEPAATNPFSKDDLDWTGFESLTDEQKDELVKNYSGWFKDKDSANAYLKATAEANKTNQEAQAKKIADLEAGWEKSLKTDADFGKDYEGNKKKVVDLLSKYTSESELAELDKYGFTKSPVLNRTLLKIAREFSDAKVVGAGQPTATVSKQPVDRFGNTMFDFTKKQ